VGLPAPLRQPSSASLLLVLENVMLAHRLVPGTFGPLLALGPGFARALIAAAVLSLAAISSEGAEGNASAGAALFADRCAGCHGRDGRGAGIRIRLLALVRGSGSPVDFTDARVMEDWPQERVALVIREGGESIRGSTLMPAYEGRLSADEIADLVAFIRSLRR
jgi:cytochrome c oxidase cbb3-type subunit III